MPAKPIFTKEQHRLVQEAAIRVWEAKFKGQPAAQKKMALALDVSQQTVSNLLRGTYRPSLRVADEISTLDGKNTLEELIGVYGTGDVDEDGARRRKKADDGEALAGPFANLDICIRFHASTKHWSPWTIAAARAGFFGNSDFSAPEWGPKLDQLEKALERARKTGTK
jgi:DNA-binding XRE family transcriptional regulator